MRRLEAGLLLCFFVSGASALIYEVLWTRMLGWFFGTTLLAVSATVAAFMAGMAFGATLGQRLADRRTDLLTLYCLMEAAMGVLGIALSHALPHLAGLSVYLSQHVPAGLFVAVQFLFLFGLLLLPTTLMGATLPILSHHLAAGAAAVPHQVARLYAINTLGAVIGALACDFVLVPAIGLRQTGSVAGLGNLAVAVMGLLLRRSLGSRPAVEQMPATPAAAPAWVLWSFALSGCCALAYEVLWTRILQFFLGAEIFVFSIILAVFLSGLALGAWAMQGWAGRTGSPAAVLAGLQIGLGVAGAGSLLVLTRLDSLLLSWPGLSHLSGWGAYLVSGVVGAVLVMLPATVAMGATFPLYIRLAQGDVGVPYAWNTLGSAAGSLLAGFVLLPWLGLQTAVLGVAVALLGLACWTAWHGPSAILRGAAVAGTAALLLALLLVPSDYLTRGTWEIRYGPLQYFADDRENSVGIADLSDFDGSSFKRLIVNGFSMTGTTFKSRRYMRLLGHLPALVHARPRRGLVICVGTGMTLSALAMHPSLTDIDCVDLSRTVRQTLPYFSDVNHDVWRDPRVHLHIDDGRHFLMAHETKYDIITFEPPPPRNAGTVNLYSEDYYRLCLSRLNPHGIVCQWLPVHQMQPDDVKACIRAFADVFGYSTLWTGYAYTDLCLMGSPDPLVLDPQHLREQLQSSPVLRQELAGIGIATAEDLLATYLHGTDSLRRYCAGTPPLTDDRPSLEYSFLPAVDVDVDYLLAQRESAEPQLTSAVDRAAWNRALMTVDLVNQFYIESLYRGDRWREDLIADSLHRVSPDNPYGQYAVRATDAWKATLEATLRSHPDDVVSIANRARWARDRGHYAAAALDWRRVLELSDPTVDTLYSCGMVYWLDGQPEAAAPYFRRALERCTDDAWRAEIEQRLATSSAPPASPPSSCSRP